jgi:hypothetical protein
LKDCREARASYEQGVENTVENRALRRDPGPSFRQAGVIVHNRGGFSTEGLFMDSRTFVRIIPGITQTRIGKRHKLGFVCETSFPCLGL